MIESRFTLRTAASVFVALILGGCPKSSPTGTASSAPGFTKAPRPSSLAITAPAQTGTVTLDADNGLALPLGLSRQLTATETFSDGTTKNVTSTVHWSSSTSSVGSVSAAGLVTTAAIGNSTVSASTDGLAQSFTLSVEPAIASIQIATDLSALWVGDVQAVVVVAALSDGTQIEVTGEATWTSGTTSVATITSDGVLTCSTVGTTLVTAAIAGFTASATATVLARQPTIASIAIGTSTKPIPGTTLTVLPNLPQALGIWATYTETGSVQNVSALGGWNWQVLDSSTATLSPSGVLDGKTAGTTTVSVSGPGGLSANLTVTVTAAVQSITLANLPASLGPDTYVFADVVATLADSTVIDVSPWATIASSNRHYVFTEGNAIIGRGAGSATITATVGSATASATANVLSISSLRIVPSSLSIPQGFTDNWIATFATLSDGSMSDVTQTANFTANGSAASFQQSNSANAPLEGMSVGNTTITASLGNVSENASVAVTPAVTVSSLAVTPPTPTLHFDGTQALTATATLSDSSLLDVTRFVDWGSGNGVNLATDFLPGLYVGLLPGGSPTITAQLGSASGSSMLTVSSSPIVSIAITQQNISLSAGQPQDLTVTATYQDTTTADVTSQVVWASTDSAGAVVVVEQTPTSRATVLAEGTGNATLTAYVSPSGPFVGGASESSATTIVTVN